MSEGTLFCNFFRKRIAEIGAGDFSDKSSLYEQLLLCCVLDALAKAAFPCEKEVGKRFTNLIREYGSWPDCKKVSLTHLRKLLSLPDAATDPRFGVVQGFVNSMPRWSEHQAISLKDDPDFSQVDRYWPKENGKPIPIRRLSAERLRHDYLFYAFRNKLAHEFNAPEVSGYTIPSDEPSYLPGEHVLYYPTGFIVKVARKSLDNLQLHFEKSHFNPRRVFRYGPFIVSELNDI